MSKLRSSLDGAGPSPGSGLPELPSWAMEVSDVLSSLPRPSKVKEISYSKIDRWLSCFDKLAQSFYLELRRSFLTASRTFAVFLVQGFSTQMKILYGNGPPLCVRHSLQNLMQRTWIDPVALSCFHPSCRHWSFQRSLGIAREQPSLVQRWNGAPVQLWMINKDEWSGLSTSLMFSFRMHSTIKATWFDELTHLLPLVYAKEPTLHAVRTESGWQRGGQHRTTKNYQKFIKQPLASHQLGKNWFGYEKKHDVRFVGK